MWASVSHPSPRSAENDASSLGPGCRSRNVLNRISAVWWFFLCLAKHLEIRLRYPPASLSRNVFLVMVRPPDPRKNLRWRFMCTNVGSHAQIFLDNLENMFFHKYAFEANIVFSISTILSRRHHGWTDHRAPACRLFFRAFSLEFLEISDFKWSNRFS